MNIISWNYKRDNFPKSKWYWEDFQKVKFDIEEENVINYEFFVCKNSKRAKWSPEYTQLSSRRVTLTYFQFRRFEFYCLNWAWACKARLIRKYQLQRYHNFLKAFPVPLRITLIYRLNRRSRSKFASSLHFKIQQNDKE